MKFTLEIELGNEAMQTPSQVGRALKYVAGGLLDPDTRGENKFGVYDDGAIKDSNGNQVGSWVVTR